MLDSLRVRGWVGIVLVEIVIVVLGVYVAAGLGSLREEAVQQERLDLMVVALAQEVGTFVSESSEFIGQVRDEFDAWKSAYESGDRPSPFFMPATGFMARPHQTLWAAMLDAGGLSLLPVNLMTQVAEFYERSERMTERYNTVSVFAREQVLPNLDLGEERFYDLDSTELRTMYEIHMRELEAVLVYVEETIELGRVLQEDPLFGGI